MLQKPEQQPTLTWHDNPLGMHDGPDPPAPDVEVDTSVDAVVVSSVLVTLVLAPPAEDVLPVLPQARSPKMTTNGMSLRFMGISLRRGGAKGAKDG